MAVKIQRMKADGSPTEIYEQFLQTLQASLSLVQAKIRRSTEHLIG